MRLSYNVQSNRETEAIFSHYLWKYGFGLNVFEIYNFFILILIKVYVLNDFNKISDRKLNLTQKSCKVFFNQPIVQSTGNWLEKHKSTEWTLNKQTRALAGIEYICRRMQIYWEKGKALHWPLYLFNFCTFCYWFLVLQTNNLFNDNFSRIFIQVGLNWLKHKKVAAERKKNA